MIASLLLLAATTAAPVATLRLDYLHAGDARGEHFAFDGLAVEGPWAGNPDRPIDDTGLGLYAFEVRDAKDGRLLYSRGFASVYGEWETTDEAKEHARGFSESVRFPLPAAPVSVILEKRKDGVFKQVWSIKVDPADPLIDRTPPTGKPWAVIDSGPSADKVDLLLLGDGYTAAEMDKWHADARRLTELLFAHSPFKQHRSDFNVWALDTPSEASGISRPSTGIYRHSPARASYDAFGSERYILTFDNKRLRELAAAAPYEFVEIITNSRTYGGGGIHNQFATVAADNAFTPYVFVHEFGHHFAALADEYYTSAAATANNPKLPEPWEPNVTADPKAGKWRELIGATQALPSLWPKAEFEALQDEIQARRRAIRAAQQPEEVMEALFREELGKTTTLLARTPGVGAFEGAMYERRGYYRPQADCIMFTRDEVGFCAVCRRAIERVIALYARAAAGR